MSRRDSDEDVVDAADGVRRPRVPWHRRGMPQQIQRRPRHREAGGVLAVGGRHRAGPAGPRARTRNGLRADRGRALRQPRGRRRRERPGTCSARNLHRVVAASPVRVIIVVGRHARRHSKTGCAASWTATPTHWTATAGPGTADYSAKPAIPSPCPALVHGALRAAGPAALALSWLPRSGLPADRVARPAAASPAQRSAAPGRAAAGNPAAAGHIRDPHHSPGP
jgi:hypothetical protein